MMKKLAKRLVSAATAGTLLLTFLAISLFSASAAPIGRSAASVGTVYKLKDYTEAVKSAITGKGSVLPSTSSDSPWTLQIQDGTAWYAADRGSTDGSWAYLYSSHLNFSDAGDDKVYLGGKFYLSKELEMLCPVYNDHGALPCNNNAAWAFTAPATGVYEFGPAANDGNFEYYDISKKFQMWSDGGNNYTVGIRITVNGAKIWPAAAGKDWEQVTAAAGVDMPTIPDITLGVGDVLRVEAKSYSSISWNEAWPFDRMWTTGTPSMKCTGEVQDTTAPVFSSGSIAGTVTGNSIALTWPAAHDNHTGGTPDYALTYKVFYSTSPFSSDPDVFPNNVDMGGIDAPGQTSLTLTGLASNTAYYICVVAFDAAGNKAKLTSGNTSWSITGFEPVTYELRDYVQDIGAYEEEEADGWMASTELAGLKTSSPWRGKVEVDGKWKTVSLATRAGSYIYAYLPDPHVDKNPGVKMYYNQDTDVKKDCHMLTPVRYSETEYYNVAWEFRAPSAGTYTFSHSDDATSEWTVVTQNFIVWSGNRKIDIRITVDGEKIWPTGDSEWQTVTSNQSNTTPVPTITGIQMKAGSALRVEASAQTADISNPYANETAVNVSMTQTDKVEVNDDQAPVFGSGDIELTAKTTTSLTVKWPAAIDDVTANDAIIYTVYRSKNPLTEDNIPSTGGIDATGETSRLLSGLDADTDYYVAVTAQDYAGNKSVLTAGPFKTLAPTGNPDDEDDTIPIIDPTQPLAPNMYNGASGIISSNENSVTVGWVISPVAVYRVYLFEKTAAGYTLVQSSGNIANDADPEYTFNNLEKKDYEIQVIGYDEEGEATSIYEVLKLYLSGAADGDNKPDEQGGLSPVTSVTLSMSIFAVVCVSSVVLLKSRKKRLVTQSAALN